MTEEQLKYRIRNIIYYKSIDGRPKAQYLHVLRTLKDDLMKLDTPWAQRVYSSIPKEITDQDLIISGLRKWIGDD